MFPTPQLILERLNEIRDQLITREGALGLLGLGSTGLQRERLDCYSDLDFFVMVEDGFKEKFLTDISWLTDIAPVIYTFQNTMDGHKLLFADGIFCEFAVFELAELSEIPYPPGRMIWRREPGLEKYAVPQKKKTEISHDQNWHLGEALTNLHVGLCREHRGEKLAAFRFIQVYAMDRVMDLIQLMDPLQMTQPDPFAGERRFEFRFPEYADILPECVQGYYKNRASAKEILCFLDAHFSVPHELKERILKLCGTII